MACRRWDVDEFRGIVRVDDFRERENGLGDDIAMFAATAGDDYFVRLDSPFHCVEDDILLQHVVLAEGGFSGFENVESAQFQMLQEVFTKRAEVGAIAKTPRSDADKLPAGNQQALNECDEAGVKIAGFHPDGTKGVPFGGVSADFSIGWIRDGGIKLGRRCSE